MTGLKIALLVLLVLWLLSLIRVGGLIEYSQEGLHAWVKAGPIRLSVFPRPAKIKEKKKKTARPAKTPGEPPKKKGGALGFVKEFLPPVLEAANHFRRKVRISPLELHLTVPGSEDPAQGAILYGQANAILGSLWQPLNQAFTIRDSRISTRADFQETEFAIYLRAGVSLRLGQWLWLLFRYGTDGLVRLLRYRSDQRKAGMNHGKEPSHQ